MSPSRIQDTLVQNTLVQDTLAENARARAMDVLLAKAFLAQLGLYDPPGWGLSVYPDRALFDAVHAFQRRQGLRDDGVMKPGGETQAELARTLTAQQSRASLQAVAKTLQDMGRHGDTILAHITPEEAQMLRDLGGAGTINPGTGLLEFYHADKRAGRYIWRTRGDGKVRSAHAERDGKVFSWDDPPEGGHPGEAPNCRCRAEDVKASDCKSILWELEAAWKRHDDLHEPIIEAEVEVREAEQRLDNLLTKLEEVQYELSISPVPERRSKGFGRKAKFGLGATVYRNIEIKNKKGELLNQINGAKWVLEKAKMKEKKLKAEREDHRLNALELKKQYDKCTGKDGGETS